MRWRIQCAAGLTAICLGGPLFAADQVVRIGAAPGEPAAYVDQQGKPQGFYVEVLNEAARREGIDLRWLMYPRRMDEALTMGTVDVWAAANPSPERHERFHISAPWWVADYILMVRAGSSIHVPSDTKGRIVLFSEFPPSGRKAWSTLPGAVLGIRNSAHERMIEVCAGEAEAALVDSNDAQRILLQRPEGCEKTALRQVPHPAMKMDLSMMSMPAKKVLVDRLRDRIEEMVRDGALAQIAIHYPLLASRSSEVMLSAAKADYERRYYLIGFAGSLVAVVSMLVLLLLLRRAQSRTRRALEKARKASRAKSDFMAVMSHEIRTPMHAALGFTELLLRSPLREDQREHANAVRNAVQSLLGVINDVLDLARLRMGPLPQVREPFSPAQLAADVAQMVEVGSEAAGLRFVLRVDPNLPATVVGDEGRLRQIATNLCSNAVKFTEKGEVEAKFELRWRGDEPWLNIRVRDTGVGIPPEKQKEIFRPFVQVDSSNTRQRGGSGLGLAIVSRLCEALGGTIELESNVGQGSTFHVSVPVSDPSPQSWVNALSLPKEPLTLVGGFDPRVDALEDCLKAAGIPVTRVMPAQPIPSGGLAIVCGASALLRMDSFDGRLVLAAPSLEIADLPDSVRRRIAGFLPWPAVGDILREALIAGHQKSVAEHPIESDSEVHAVGLLVVEDNEINRRVITRMLAHLGWHIEVAENGREAVDRFAPGRFAAILMDCQMPVMDGLQATLEIRRREGSSHTPIIGVTAAAFQEDRERCMEAGMDDFLAKPVSLDQLREMLRKWVVQPPVGEAVARG
ncbi:MAG TPA: ATP-binding protein [Bryobacteraceae bacterium]|nr:ATP-binding protein [Bryobacteraceae bacterium]